MNAASLTTARAAKAGGVVSGEVLDAVAALGSGAVADVSRQQHLALLAFLCDEALDTLLLHNLLQSALPDSAVPDPAPGSRSFRCTQPAVQLPLVLQMCLLPLGFVRLSAAEQTAACSGTRCCMAS